MIQTLKDTGSEYQIPSSYDGACYDVAVGGDCVIGGIGDEFDIDYNASSLVVSFNAGSQALIGGNFFHITENESVTLQPNSVIYLTARIDTTQPNGSTGVFYQTTEQGIQKQNINGSGTQRDLLLYIITTSASGVSNVQDMRVIKDNRSTSYNNVYIWVGTQAEYDLLTPQDDTLYFIKAEEE